MGNNFELFRHEAKYWVDYFGLYDWRWDFVEKEPPEHLRLRNKIVYLAWYEASAEDRVALIGLNIDNSDETQYSISKAAFHEVCEVLLFDMEDIGLIDAPPSTKEGMLIRKHAVIRTLENTIFEDNYLTRKVLQGKEGPSGGRATS